MRFWGPCGHGLGARSAGLHASHTQADATPSPCRRLSALCRWRPLFSLLEIWRFPLRSLSRAGHAPLHRFLSLTLGPFNVTACRVDVFSVAAGVHSLSQQESLLSVAARGKLPVDRWCVWRGRLPTLVFTLESIVCIAPTPARPRGPPPSRASPQRAAAVTLKFAKG